MAHVERASAGHKLGQLVGDWFEEHLALPLLQRVADHLHVYSLDLDSPDCETRRRAITKLGELGDRRAVATIETARTKDDKATPWYKLRCIGSRADEAEKKLMVAHR